uniref:hypothetical protein n=1 Tax=Halomonas sp. TaxID=1486246 RepID=UPI003F937247
MPSVILVAAIPYMWRLKEPAQPQVENPAAGQFLFASGLFLTSEVAIFYRKLEHHKLVAFCHASGFSAMFIHALQSEINDRATLGHPTDIGLDDEQAKWQLNEVIKPSIRFF